MSYLTIYRQDVHQDYKARPLSAAALFQLLLFGVMVGVPIALVAINPDIWPMYTTIYEQPFVRYQQMAFVHLDLGGGSSLTWSTIPQYNRLMGATLRPTLLKSREEDFNGDRKPDRLHVTLDVPLKPQEQVFGVSLFIFLDYILQKRTSFEMATVASIQYKSASAGAEFLADGCLRLLQKDALRPDAYDFSLKDPLINTSSSDNRDYSMIDLMKKLASRNASTALDVIFPIWVAGPTPGEPFHIEVSVQYPVQSIWMETTVLHKLTTAGAAFTFWLLPFWLACHYFRQLVFASGLLFTVKDTSKYSMKKYITSKD